MTREEMIRKVCEAHVKNSNMRGTGGFLCLECDLFGDTLHHSHHAETCSVGYAERILAEPVIEVGDVVKVNKTGHEFEVVRIADMSKIMVYEVDHGNTFLRNKFHYIGDLTLVRKGNQS